MKNKLTRAMLLIGSGLLASATALAGPSGAAVVSNTCAGCHGTDGASVGPAPVIVGLAEMYLASTMAAYKDGTRYGTVMNRIAKGYDQAQIQAMAKHLSGKPWVSGKQEIDPALAKKGQELHNGKGCVGCHGANGISMLPTAPRMAGQYADYLYFQMKDYANDSMPIPPAAMPMRMLSALSDEDLKALAAFYASAQ
jgi:sulfide dehydrogenase cytochrome subunit